MNGSLGEQVGDNSVKQSCDLWITLFDIRQCFFRDRVEADGLEVIDSIVALHQALAWFPRHPLMEDKRTAWGQVDHWC
jgi:hypothetical protein